jgi:tRNA pseudouridine-54 N-methylase
MKPRFCTSPLEVSDAVERAWRTYAMLYGRPAEPMRLALQTYINRLVNSGERNQDQLIVKALIYLKKHEGKSASAGENAGFSNQRAAGLLSSKK